MTEETKAEVAQFTSPEARVSALVQSMLDGLLGEATTSELIVLQSAIANGVGPYLHLRAALTDFAANLVKSAGQIGAEPPAEPQPQPFHDALGIEQREPKPQAVDVAGLMRMLGADATEH